MKTPLLLVITLGTLILDLVPAMANWETAPPPMTTYTQQPVNTYAQQPVNTYTQQPVNTYAPPPVTTYSAPCDCAPAVGYSPCNSTCCRRGILGRIKDRIQSRRNCCGCTPTTC